MKNLLYLLCLVIYLPLHSQFALKLPLSGSDATASGEGSTAMGSSTASGIRATAMGSSIASGQWATAMGSSEASEKDATAMGFSFASGEGSTAIGKSTASGDWSTAMGASSASNTYATAMGFSLASNTFATAMGASTASGDFSLAAGRATIASGSYSVALGRNVNTNGKTGAFFFGDNDPKSRPIGFDNQFACRFKGGYYFISGFSDPANSAGDIGVRIPANGNSWVNICDQNRKENFLLLDDVHILEKLTSIPYYSWNYKGLDPAADRHYGIMAQDFYHLFGQDSFGTIGCDTLVNPIDMLGVTMSAIKGLKTLLDEEKIKVQKLNEVNEGLQNQLMAINQILLEQQTAIQVLSDQLFKVQALQGELSAPKNSQGLTANTVRSGN